MKFARILITAALLSGFAHAQTTAPSPVGPDGAKPPEGSSPSAEGARLRDLLKNPLSSPPGAGSGSAPAAQPGAVVSPAPPFSPSVPPVPPDPATEKLRKEIAKIVLEKDKLLAEMALEMAKRDRTIAERRLKIADRSLLAEEMRSESDFAEAQRRKANEGKLAALKTEQEQAALEMNIALAKAEAANHQARLSDIAVKGALSEMSLAMELQQKQEEMRNFADRTPTYAAEPLEGKILNISDRRIALNGPIMTRTAEEISERIAYYNNKDRQLPIFIVIDNSPGGSVMAGYKILKAMQGSDAPVYVVVKSFAASMAATLTTLAERSFAYPNAIILHHQMSSFMAGNMTEQAEALKDAQQWWERLAKPIADKMGITMEDLVKQMYAKNSNGDWQEFADQAQKLKWVDIIVDEIRETSQTRHPDVEEKKAEKRPLITLPMLPGISETSNLSEEKTDENGRRFIRLPRLSRPDLYWIFNPDQYYRN